jgi:hypothetical protein
MFNSIANRFAILCLIAGFLCIPASIAIWFFYQGNDPAHAERFGIFVGLWAPTFFILSNSVRLQYPTPGA